MNSFLARMFRYVAWADRRMLEALHAATAAHAEATPLMAHILAAESLWLSRLEQRDARHLVWPTLSLSECDALWAENEDGYRDYIAALNEDQLTTTVRYRNSQGQEFIAPILDILTQVITHGPYHRGQIAKIIGRSGSSAASTDFITYAREVEPAE